MVKKQGTGDRGQGTAKAGAKPWVQNALLLCGVSAVGTGIAMIYLPAGVIAVGIGLIYFAFLLDIDESGS
jgi:hypothetical protein